MKKAILIRLTIGAILIACVAICSGCLNPFGQKSAADSSYSPGLEVPSVVSGLIQTTALTYSGGNASVSLSWQSPADASTQASDQQYKVCYSSADPAYNSFSTIAQVTSGTCVTQIGATTATLTIPKGHAYYINVVVTNQQGNSAVYSAKGEFLDSSEVAYFPLEGSLNDVTGGNNLAAASYNSTTETTGTFSTDRFGNSNAAYYFGTNNTSACLMTSSNVDSSVTGTNARSVSFWANSESHSNTFDLFSIGEDQSAHGVHFGLRFDTSQNFYGLWGYGDDFYSTQGATSGWHHWVVTYSGGTGSPIGGLYVDDTQVLSTTAFSPYYTTTASPLFIGCDIDGSLGTAGAFGQWFSGSISDVRVFNRVLCDGTGTNGCASTTNEIANIYNSSRP